MRSHCECKTMWLFNVRHMKIARNWIHSIYHHWMRCWWWTWIEIGHTDCSCSCIAIIQWISYSFFFFALNYYFIAFPNDGLIVYWNNLKLHAATKQFTFICFLEDKSVQRTMTYKSLLFCLWLLIICCRLKIGIS